MSNTIYEVRSVAKTSRPEDEGKLVAIRETFAEAQKEAIRRANKGEDVYVCKGK